MRMLLWKEWREHRLIFFVSIAIVIITRMFLSLLPLTYIGRETLGLINKDIIIATHLVTYELLSLLFTLLFGTAPFTNEFSNKTVNFLLCQPITRARIYWTKFFFGLFLLTFLILFVYFLFPSLGFKHPFSIDSNTYYVYIYHKIHMYFIFSVLTIYSTAFFTSFLFKNALFTIITTPFVVAIGFLLIFIPLLPVSLWIPIHLFKGYTLAILFGLALFFLFISLGFLCWQKVISWSKYPAKILTLVLASAISLFLVTYTIANFVAGMELRNATRAAKKAGLPLTIKEIIPSPVPDSENAALVYNEIYSIYEKLNKGYSKEWEYMPFVGKVDIRELSLAQKERLAELVFNDPDFIRMYELIKKAVDMPSCRFNIKYEDGFNMILPHPHKMRAIATMTSVKIFLLTEQDRYDEALEFARIGLRLGNALENDPIIISQLVRRSCDDIVMRGLRKTISNMPSDAVPTDACRRLITEIGSKEGIASLKKGLEGTIAISREYIFEMALRGQAGHYKDFWRLLYMPNINKRIQKMFWKLYPSYLGRPIVRKDTAFYLSSMVNFTNLCLSPYYQIKDKINELKKEFRKETPIALLNNPVSSMILLPVEIIYREAVNTAKLDGLKIALALKIYRAEEGEYPDSLAVLIPEYLSELPKDPFTGKNYIYHRKGKHFSVYSAGINEKDDGGVYKEWRYYYYDNPDNLIWGSSK